MAKIIKKGKESYVENNGEKFRVNHYGRQEIGNNKWLMRSKTKVW